MERETTKCISPVSLPDAGRMANRYFRYRALTTSGTELDSIRYPVGPEPAPIQVLARTPDRPMFGTGFVSSLIRGRERRAAAAAPEGQVAPAHEPPNFLELSRYVTGG